MKDVMLVYKVMLVDDDAFARTSLKGLMNWEKHGYIICAEASNGSNAVEMIQRIAPDIVITDISMPIMDGIGLIEYLVENHPAVIVIALSGYDDFDYVRQSLKLGAIDYLLKHRVNETELLNILQAACKRIQKECQALTRERSVAQQLQLGKEALKREFLQQLTTGTLKEPENIELQMNRLEIELTSEYLTVMIIEMDDFTQLQTKYTLTELDTVIKSFLDLASEILKDYGKSLIFQINGGRFVVIFSFGNCHSQAYCQTQINDCIERIRNSIARYLNFTASLSVGRTAHSFKTIVQSYHEAEQFLKNKFYEGKDHVYRDSGFEPSGQSAFSIDVALEKKLLTELKSFNISRVSIVIEGIFSDIAAQKINYQSTQMICIELMNLVTRVAREYNLEKLVYSGPESPYLQLSKLETLDDLKQMILGLYGKLGQLLEKMGRRDHYSEYTEKAVHYIYNHYQEDISLDDAASFAGVSGSYLSRVFKEDSGKGFVEFLNWVRVERAKLMIENQSGKLKFIVKEVGFNNYNYFFKVFKDQVGLTPLDYERNCKEEVNKKME